MPGNSPPPGQVRIDERWWALGVVDAYNGVPPRAGIPDGFSYQSGRVEGEAARLSGQNADAVLIAHRSPFRAAHFLDAPCVPGSPKSES